MLTRSIIPRRDPDGLKDVLARLVAGVKERLGTNYVGAYLQGSLATGGFDDASDVDFLIVVEEDVPSDIVDRLQDFHRALYEQSSAVCGRVAARAVAEVGRAMAPSNPGE